MRAPGPAGAVKIGVVGCGALGSFYGAKLCRAGETVHFLLRSDFEAVRRQGVQIESVEGDFHVRGGISTVVTATYEAPARGRGRKR